ncbi:MAG: tetrahydrofolate dehydrogenase/cyclohydrolase catalytic domain-containing protein [Candidatus Thermoplasmatota archaeon]|jgi:methylenetetrahydrofolate dehydrogenase (NADP+)/methenyltetrahydrofolate cyclohydrolase|nr:tetrahydrofolate dehydrogenase/cyclohydrolase catalytic domain-containing protein [Candidatus Thermoplasmatota archaeon]
MTAKIIYGKPIAEDIRKKIKKEITILQKKHGVKPSITTIKIGEDPSSELYLKLRDKACEEVGIKSRHLVFHKNAPEKKVLESIKKLNDDNSIHGILIQYPVPKHISPDKLMKTVDPSKDVEGFNPKNMGGLLIGDEHIVSCTPLAVLTILEYEKTVLKSKNVTIVNHSNVVGKPLAALFLNRNATVSVCHVYTDDIKKYTNKADILVTATGKPKLITKDHVKNNSFVIDVGINKTKNGLCGDVDFDSVKEKIGKITPVPGGVGPVTVACSLINMIKTFKNCVEEK